MDQAKKGVLAASHEGFIPAEDAVISPAKLVQVFGGSTVPFQLNADGSANRVEYVAWLGKVGQDALQAFEDHSVILYPKVLVPSASRTEKKRAVV